MRRLAVGLAVAAGLVCAAPAGASQSAVAPGTIRWAHLRHAGLTVTVAASSKHRRRTADLRIYVGRRLIRQRVFTFTHGRVTHWRMHLAPRTYALTVRVRKHRVLKQRLVVTKRTVVPPPPPPPPPTESVVVGIAGDFCSGSCTQGAATAAVIQAMNPLRFLNLGDSQYPQGDQGTFDGGYAKAFAALHGITDPVFGSTHDFAWAGYPVSFFNQNGAPEVRGKLSDGQPGYSFEVGAWHMVALNYNGGQAAVDWLKADLAAHPSKCLAAIDHAPFYGSPTSEHPSNEGSLFNAALEAAGADLFLSGHQHMYERLTTPTGTQIITGTGGIGHYQRTSTATGSQAYNDANFGAVKLTLSASGWSSEFVPDPGSSFTDVSSGGC